MKFDNINSIDNEMEGVANDVEAREYEEARERPNPEQLLLRMAIKQLSAKQKELWEMFAYDQLTEDEIGRKLGIDQSGVSRKLAAIQDKITKWCKLNRGAYMLLKLDAKMESGE